MILQALKGYYDRKAQDPDSALAPEGWIEKGIDFVIVLEKDGRVANVECLQTREGKRKIPKPDFVPYIGKQAIKHTNSGRDANLLWDNSSFVLGLGNKGNIKIASFLEAIDARLSTEDDGVKAVRSFIIKGIDDPAFFESILQHSSYGEEIASGFPNVTFRLSGDNAPYVFYRANVKAKYETKISESLPSYEGTCLVTGDTGIPISIKHPSIKNLYGQKKIAPLVSCNEDAYDSYCKKGKQRESDSFDQSKEKKGVNAPVSIQASVAYSKALASLLNSKQKLQVGDATTVFWAEKQDGMEDMFGDLLRDDPDRDVKEVESLYLSIKKGVFNTDSDTRFFVLGLAPNAARISVRFWQVGTVAEIAGRIRQYFLDLEIVRDQKLSPYLSLQSNRKNHRALLNSLVLEGDPSRIPPNLAGDTIRSILSGVPYPATLLQAAIRRIHAEQEVTHPRAALIKACINRKSGKEELKVSLDENNMRPAYRLGRLFAVLERIQEEAIPGIGTTIRNTYWGAASRTPGKVFPLLTDLSTKHLTKIRREKPGRMVNLEKLVGKIMEPLEPDAPFRTTFSLEDQGRFIIGYYHQKLHPSTYKTQGE